MRRNLSKKSDCLSGGGAAVSPASAAALPGVGAALVPPSSVAFAAPAVPAMAVSVGGGSYAGVLGGAGAGRRGSHPWFFAVWVVVFSPFGFFACLSVCFGSMIPDLYKVTQYSLFLSGLQERKRIHISGEKRSCARFGTTVTERHVHPRDKFPHESVECAARKMMMEMTPVPPGICTAVCTAARGGRQRGYDRQHGLHAAASRCSGETYSGRARAAAGGIESL